MTADYERRWGKDPVQSKAIVNLIDSAGEIEASVIAGRRESVRKVIFKALKERNEKQLNKIDDEVFARLEIGFLDVNKRQRFGEIRIPGNDQLSQVRIGIFDLYGAEVLTTLDLSLRD